MNCLKCGREISEEEVFCVDCRLEAQRYPINPNTAIFLPRRKKQEPAKKASKRRVLSMEEQVRFLRRRLTIVTASLILAVGIILAMLYPALSYMTKEHYAKGQNYFPMATVAPSSEPTQAAAQAAD